MAQEFVLKDKYSIDDLIAIIKVLRAPGGCPWDREQTHESIKKNFIEETYEVVEAINKNSADMLREELGDVLLQIVLHTEMESEKGSFTFDDVANDIVQKLVVRHPHVFGDVVANDTAEALNSWDAAKLKSKGQKSKPSLCSACLVNFRHLCVHRKFNTRLLKSALIGIMSAVRLTNSMKRLMS